VRVTGIEHMNRHLTLIGAASSLGIKPYDDGTIRHLDRAPATLRQLGLGDALVARDAGDVLPEPYRDFIRPPGGVRNEPEVVRYSTLLAERVAMVLSEGGFPIVIGGDCSNVLGSLLGARRAGKQRVGLVYIDAHADFATPADSATGSAASMDLALATGRGKSPLATLAAERPLVQAADIVLVGRRDDADGLSYGHAALAASEILDLPMPLDAEGLGALAAQMLARVAAAGVDGFWIHVDADVLSPGVMIAVDSPEPGGPDIEQLAALLVPLLASPRAIGLQLTIYDPALDPGLDCGRRLVSLLRSAFAGRMMVVSR
jgi:arginase